VANTGTLPPDLGQNRTTQTMTGYATGLVEQRTGDTFRTLAPSINIFNPSTNLSISTNAATNQAMATIVMSGYDGTLGSAKLQLGGQSGANGPASAFIDNSRYAMITQTNDPSRQSTIGRSTPLNNNTMLASYQTAPVVLPPASAGSGAVQPCTCEYLTWGFWSSNINLSSNQTANVNLGTYVAGQVTSNMPLTGSATYNGMMVGNVQNGSNAYVGTGTYAMDWSFQRRNGTFGATFDGTRYGGLVGSTGGANFSGVFGNLGTLRGGTLAGSFFGPNAQNQGGQFAIGGPGYAAAGIFAGQR
jgi:hypothetical protein